MKTVLELLVQRGRLVSALSMVVLLPVFVVSEVRGARARAELATDRAFIERARAAAKELRGAQGVHCDAPLGSSQPGKAFFGVTQGVALVVAPEGERLDWPGHPAEMIVGHDGCARRVESLDAMSAYPTMGIQLEAAARTPWRHLDRLLDVDELPVCMGSQSTDFGMVLVPRLTRDGAQLTGRVDVRIMDFRSGQVRCEGSAAVRLPWPDGDEPTQDRALAREYGELVERILAAAQAADASR